MTNHGCRYAILGLVALGLLSGCGEKHTSTAHEAQGGGHSHVAPHGGTLTEIGEHAFNVEWVRDAGQGSLDAYILDGHAENFVRLPLPAFSIILESQPTPLTLAAVASPQTGETVGNTSHFRVQSDAIKGTNGISGEIKGLEIRGQIFDKVKFILP